jgi:hypothetical protein
MTSSSSSAAASSSDPGMLRSSEWRRLVVGTQRGPLLHSRSLSKDERGDALLLSCCTAVDEQLLSAPEVEKEVENEVENEVGMKA